MIMTILFGVKSLCMKIISVVVIGALLAGSGLFVYHTGGIKYVFSHSMYIPIVLAAVLFRTKGGILAGLIGGLIIGPYMPITTMTGEMQPAVNWLFRLGLFCLVGGFVGTIINKLQQTLTYEDNHLSASCHLRFDRIV